MGLIDRQEWAIRVLSRLDINDIKDEPKIGT